MCEHIQDSKHSLYLWRGSTATTAYVQRPVAEAVQRSLSPANNSGRVNKKHYPIYLGSSETRQKSYWNSFTQAEDQSGVQVQVYFLIWIMSPGRHPLQYVLVKIH